MPQRLVAIIVDGGRARIEGRDGTRHAGRRLGFGSTVFAIHCADCLGVRGRGLDECEFRQKARSDLRGHQNGHGQCADQCQQPGRASGTDLLNSQQAKCNQDDRAHHQGAHGGFKQQMSVHDFFPFFDAAMRSARR